MLLLATGQVKLPWKSTETMTMTIEGMYRTVHIFYIIAQDKE